MLDGQDICGVITPADLNKLAARTYFYNLLAELEITLAGFIHKHKYTEDKIFALIGDDEKRQEQIQKKLDDASLELDIVHTLYLSEMVNLLQRDNDDTLRKKLGFSSKRQVKKRLNGLVDFRNAVMHPFTPILSKEIGVEKLHKRLNRTVKLLDRWNPTDQVTKVEE